MDRILVLEDGTWFRGEAAGSDHFRIGSLIFNTAMTLCINPTARDLWFAHGKKEIHVPAGQTVSF